MSVPLRELSPGQRTQVWIHDTASGTNTLHFETASMLLEAPNWSLDGSALIVNGEGVLWRLPLDQPRLEKIEISGVPRLNNDHVLDPDGVHVFLSAYDDWQLYRAPLKGGVAQRISGREGPAGLYHFLHGVSPDGGALTFVGVRAEEHGTGLRFISAEICTLAADGSDFRQITQGGKLCDGPEYSPDGKWIYFNTEAFCDNAQIARMRPDGSEMTRLSFSNTVDWFPHHAPDGSKVVYLAFPPGTRGHPADLWVELMLVENGDWENPRSMARLFGGQGTINVNSWSPDSTRFAYVAYPR